MIETMGTTVEAVTVAYLTGAEPALTGRARYAQAKVRVVTDIVSGATDVPNYTGYTQAVSTLDFEGTAQAAQLALGLSSDVAPNTSSADRTAVKQLISFATLEDNWDGMGAAKPLLHSLSEARKFLRRLSSASVLPRATLHADGHAILFLRESDRYAEIEFLGNNTISYYARRGDKEWGDEIHFDGRNLPDGLSQIGFAI